MRFFFFLVISFSFSSFCYAQMDSFYSQIKHLTFEEDIFQKPEILIDNLSSKPNFSYHKTGFWLSNLHLTIKYNDTAAKMQRHFFTFKTLSGIDAKFEEGKIEIQVVKLKTGEVVLDEFNWQLEFLNAKEFKRCKTQIIRNFEPVCSTMKEGVFDHKNLGYVVFQPKNKNGKIKKMIISFDKPMHNKKYSIEFSLDYISTN